METTNQIYKRQLAILLFIMTFTYKVSRLPSLVAETVGSSGTFLISLYLALEVVMFAIIYRFVTTDGRNTLKEDTSYKALSGALAVGFLFKLTLMYAGAILFAMELLFESISLYEVACALILPIFYLAYKGVRVIARVGEICFWLIAGVLLLTFVFIKANPVFSNNLPLLNGSFSELLSDGDKFFFWFGDFTPFLFLTLKNNRRNPVGISLFISVVIIIFCFVLMYALYGAGAQYISNFIVKLASFNQFAAKLGRLDWTGMIIWLIMGVIYLSVYLWAFAEAAGEVIKKRKLWVFTGAAAMLITVIAVGDITKIVTFVQGDVRWYAVAVNYVIPLIFALLAAAEKKKRAQKNAPAEEKIEQGA